MPLEDRYAHISTLAILRIGTMANVTGFSGLRLAAISVSKKTD